MSKIVEYTLVAGKDVPTMLANVNFLIQEGWKPQGGVAFSPDGSLFFQAMIKEEET